MENKSVWLDPLEFSMLEQEFMRKGQNKYYAKSLIVGDTIFHQRYEPRESINPSLDTKPRD